MTLLNLLPVHDVQSLHKTAQRPQGVNHLLTIFLVPYDEYTARHHPLLPDHSAIHGLGPHHGSECPAKTCKVSRDTLFHLALIPPVLRSHLWLSQKPEVIAAAPLHLNFPLEFWAGSHCNSTPSPPPPGRAGAPRNHEAGRVRDSSKWTHSHVLCRVPGTELCAQKRERRMTTVWGLKYGRSEITTHVYKVSTASQPNPARVGPRVHGFGTARCWIHQLSTVTPLHSKEHHPELDSGRPCTPVKQMGCHAPQLRTARAMLSFMGMSKSWNLFGKFCDLSYSYRNTNFLLYSERCMMMRKNQRCFYKKE